MDEETVEKEAKAMGWAALEDFRGDPERWVDADTFVKRGKEQLPILKENLERLVGKIDKLEAARNEDKKTFEQFREFTTKAEERAHKQAEAAYKKELSDLKNDLKVAAREQDEAKIDRITTSIDNLKPPDPPPPVVAPTPDQAPEFIDWKTKNQWYGSDPEMSIYADAMGQFVKNTHPGMIGVPFFEEVTKHVKEKFSNKFENQKKTIPAATESGIDTLPVRSKHGFADLPEDAKAAYNHFKRLMPKYTKEEYMSQYNWDEEVRR